jgi:hypothetical protein
MVELRILQLNVRKQREVQLSLLNNKRLHDYGALLIAEPHVWPTEEGELIVVPTHHQNWVRLLPSKRSKERWQIRGMIWVHEDIEVKQIAIDSSDLTAAVLHTPESRILVIPVYMWSTAEGRRWRKRCYI